MRRFLLFISMVLLVNMLSAQTEATDFADLGRNGVYFEGYAIRHDFSTGPVSLNYERLFGKKVRSAVRIGVYPDWESTVSFPVTWSWITHPTKKHHFEAGAGLVFRIERYQGNTYKDIPAAMFPVMYRFSGAKGFFARAGINLWVSWPTIPSPSASLGWRF